MRKIFSKTKPLCKVTFSLPISACENNKKLTLVGDFNDWDESNGISMSKSTKDEIFKKTLELETGKDYQFRYLADGKDWYNDHCADWYCPSGYTGVENSVISLPKQADDLTKIEGIGPKISSILNSKGIVSFEDLAKSKKTILKEALADAGSKYQMHDPTSWPQQSKLAAKGDWTKLTDLQNKLIGGK